MLETFIIGSKGLIGSAILDNLANSKPFPIRMPWESLEKCISILESWNIEKPNTGIVWAAGTSGVSATDDTLDFEVELFRAFLSALKRNEDNISYVLLASSAGGVYGEVRDEIITESTIPNPISAYGKMKLVQENELIQLAHKSQFNALIARISNAYGTAQNLEKKQGLISLLVKAALVGEPITIYVPMETKRDYIYSKDVGKKISRFISECQTSGSKVKVKIITSGAIHSIAEIVSEIDRLMGISTPIIFANQRETNLQPNSLVFRSVIMTAIDDYQCVSLADGINMIINGQQMRKQ